MSIPVMESIAYIAMILVAFVIPAFLAKRIEHGEARFDTTKRKDADED
ncbi:hypothetical protein [Aurantiacibacter sediminis]|uniref:Uncharacterized protein n=1 Tax=Aurantiacibacter sediminis TaxID=2793064 RepID=A0ABS0N6I0_9SPHN|nr:hypothetical protein [Aurantiacibacter sediminis]MBH5323371.1 hypothetical protein [Aurantiacibacter sediminis]